MPSGISVIGFPTGVLSANCYLVINEATRECIIVDPGSQAKQIIANCEGFEPKAVLLTHAHFDHFGAADEVCSHFHLPLHVHWADIPALTDMQANVSEPFGTPMQVSATPIPLEGGETIRLAGMDIRVIHTPGHTVGGVCYLLPNNAGILTGDTLMVHGYGRTDFAGGSMEQLMQSLRTLWHLSPRIPMYPGHGEYGMVGKDPEDKEK